MIPVGEGITIVGLGPGPAGLRTVVAQQALDGASRIFVRSHEDVDLSDLPADGRVTDLSGLRQPDGDPGGRWAQAAHTVCDAAADGPLVLAIPGHPRFGEGLVLATLAEAESRGLETRVVDGISVVDLVATAVGKDPILSGVQLLNAREALELVSREPFASGLLTHSPRRPVLMTHVYDNAICSALGRVLLQVYPSDHPVICVEAAGSAGQRIAEYTIGDLAKLSGGPLVALWIPAMHELAAIADPRTMHHIVARLRQPDGCPWDRKQTNATLRDALINEVYEAVDAIDANDPANLAEELGDLYLLILMHAQIAHEKGEFSIEDVYRGIATKIVGRHPHVFGDAAAADSDDVVGIWNAVKATEVASGAKRGSKDVDGEPFSMPALSRATRVLKKTPIVVGDNTPPFLAMVAGIIAEGGDPEAILMQQLRDHVANQST